MCEPVYFRDYETHRPRTKTDYSTNDAHYVHKSGHERTPRPIHAAQDLDLGHSEENINKHRPIAMCSSSQAGHHQRHRRGEHATNLLPRHHKTVKEARYPCPPPPVVHGVVFEWWCSFCPSTRNKNIFGVPDSLEVRHAPRPLDSSLLFTNLFSTTLQVDDSIDRGLMILPQRLATDGGCPIQDRNCFVVLALRTSENVCTGLRILASIYCATAYLNGTYRFDSGSLSRREK